MQNRQDINRNPVKTHLLLGVEDSLRLTTLKTFDPNLVAWLAARGRVHGLDTSVLAVLGGGAEEHSVRLDAAHRNGLEVANTNHHAVLHLLDGHKVDQSTKDGSRAIGLSKVDLLQVEVPWRAKPPQTESEKALLSIKPLWLSHELAATLTH